jgi:hypothetical protein
VRRHAGCPSEAGSYCNALQKRVKPFVRNRKGVIGLFDHSRGPPTNRGSLVTERTHIKGVIGLFDHSRGPPVLFISFSFVVQSSNCSSRGSSRGRSNLVVI